MTALLIVFNRDAHVARSVFPTKEDMERFLVQLRSGEWGETEKISKSGPSTESLPPWWPTQGVELEDDFRPFVKKRLSKRKTRPLEIKQLDGSIQSTIPANTFVYSSDS